MLTDFGIGIMTFLTSADAVNFYGSLSGEPRRDPELARSFYEAGPGRTLANLSSVLRSPLASDLHIDDAGRAAEMLIGLWQGMTTYKLMLGIDHDEVVSSIPDRVARGVELFLHSIYSSR